MTHATGTREQWLKARKELLLAEKELTHKSDAVAAQRASLPWVRVEKDYRFDTDGGNVKLAELFKGCSQLLVYHFMFGPDYAAGCPSCSMIADGFNGYATHLAQHDVMLWAVSRAPLAKIAEYKKRMGWSFPWASSFGTDFNFDYSVGFTEDEQFVKGIEYNYVREQPRDRNAPASMATTFANQCKVDTATYLRERPGMSAFVLADGVVHHTYSSYSRGVDAIWGVYPWLDRAPLGRNEKGIWWKRHDEYEAR